MLLIQIIICNEDQFSDIKTVNYKALRPCKFPFKDLDVRAVYKNVVIIIIKAVLYSFLRVQISQEDYF